jgi:hypothetical protein
VLIQRADPRSDRFPKLVHLGYKFEHVSTGCLRSRGERLAGEGTQLLADLLVEGPTEQRLYLSPCGVKLVPFGGVGDLSEPGLRRSVVEDRRRQAQRCNAELIQLGELECLTARSADFLASSTRAPRARSDSWRDWNHWPTRAKPPPKTAPTTIPTRVEFTTRG